MAKQYIHTEVDNRKLKLSNLQKVLYPSINATKAEIIQYYLEVAEDMLPFVKNRPLTLIRWPDGIQEKKFYAKSKPKWTPDWLNSIPIQHSDKVVDYLLVEDRPGIVWLANLAALEIHPMQMEKDKMDTPDHFIFDIDPPEGGQFADVIHMAKLLKNFLQGYGYTPFVKTSGSKGLHIFVPIAEVYSHEEMVAAVKELASIFVKANSDIATLSISKEKRHGRTLIDILRNHESHTTVAPYSLRGKPGAPISFPIPWSMIDDLSSSQSITIKNYNSYLTESRIAWRDFFDAAEPLHTHKSGQTKLKVHPKLESYINKRDFSQTTEPMGGRSSIANNRFCIQLHDATNLHYDLRLEEDGILRSWAIPKGLPYENGIKHLAIETEPHPIKYLDFEGTIPPGQYGAGEMILIHQGIYTAAEMTDKKVLFQLNGTFQKNSYKLYKIKSNNGSKGHWLVELEQSKFDIPQLPLAPMLATQSKKVPEGIHLSYEIKWDGIRVIVSIEKEKVIIYSRSGRIISEQFPELLDPKIFKIEQGIFDGEIVCLDEKGRPIFSHVISRMHSVGGASVKSAKRKYPAVCYLFDCIAVDGQEIYRMPLRKRHRILALCFKKNKSYQLSESISDGKGLFEATKDMGMEGIMAKDLNAVYLIGQRSDRWVKVKHRSTLRCLIAGYTKGQGDRANLFGALHLLKNGEKGRQYMGKVGTGFDSAKMKSLLSKFKEHIIIKKAFSEKTDDDHTSIWLQPTMECLVEYASLSSNGTLREPVFLKLLE